MDGEGLHVRGEVDGVEAVEVEVFAEARVGAHLRAVEVEELVHRVGHPGQDLVAAHVSARGVPRGDLG